MIKKLIFLLIIISFLILPFTQSKDEITLDDMTPKSAIDSSPSDQIITHEEIDGEYTTDDDSSIPGYHYTKPAKDPNDMSPSFSDKYVRSRGSRGQRGYGDPGRFYRIDKAETVWVDGFVFEDIKESEIQLKEDGRLKTAWVVSDVDNNEIKFLNPIGHLDSPVEYSTGDSDDDLLSDLVEAKFKTDANFDDSDGDGISDADEILFYGTNSLMVNNF